MKIIKENTVLAGVSELRTGLDEILAQLKRFPVVLEKHHRPVAILVEPARFAAMSRALGALKAARRGRRARRR